MQEVGLPWVAEEEPQLCSSRNVISKGVVARAPGCLRGPLRMRACRCKACPFCQARLADSANQMRQARKSGKMRRRGMMKKQEQSESTVTVTVNTPAPTTPRKRRKRRKGAPEAAAPAA